MTILDHHHDIAYFGMRSTPDRTGYIGAALVVDPKGLPLEFRCSVPVRPSGIQEALYGHRIYNHIAVDLCGLPLLQSLATKPAVCLVESVSLWDLQQYLSLPVFHVERVDSNPASDSETGDSGQAGESHQPSRFRRNDGNGSDISGVHSTVRIDSPNQVRPDFPEMPSALGAVSGGVCAPFGAHVHQR